MFVYEDAYFDIGSVNDPKNENEKSNQKINTKQNLHSKYSIEINGKRVQVCY